MKNLSIFNNNIPVIQFIQNNKINGPIHFSRIELDDNAAVDMTDNTDLSNDLSIKTGP